MCLSRGPLLLLVLDFIFSVSPLPPRLKGTHRNHRKHVVIPLHKASFVGHKGLHVYVPLDTSMGQKGKQAAKAKGSDCHEWSGKDLCLASDGRCECTEKGSKKAGLLAAGRHKLRALLGPAFS